jgi:uncharacterized membrane protein YfcA
MEFLDLFNIYLPVAGTEFNVLLLLAIGFCVGVLGGFFGVGGAWIVTPALNIFGFPMPYAIGTDFAHIFGKSIVATKKHGKMGNVDWKLGFTIPLGTILGVEIGAQVIMAMEKWGETIGYDLVGSVVRWTYIIMLFSLSSWMMYDYFVIRKRKEQMLLSSDESDFNQPRKKTVIEKLRDIKIPPMISYPKSGIESISIWVIIFIFFFAGLISGFLGVGGGFIKMPTMVYLLGCPTALAVGTDLFVVMLDGAYGCFTYAMKGRVELFAAVFMLVGASIGAQIGVTAVKYIRGYGIRLLFAVMIAFAGLSVLLKQLETMTGSVALAIISGIVIMGASYAMTFIIIFKLIKEVRKERISNL